MICDARECLASVFARNVPVFLAYSGGKESALLARLAEPFAGRFKLLWVNTGFTFPQVESFVRAAGERFGLEEIRTDLAVHWREFGLPAEILPVANALGGGVHREPKLQPFATCCLTLRTMPVVQFLNQMQEPTVLIHGQRLADRAPGNGFSGYRGNENVSVVAPLLDWSTEHVFAAIEAEHVELPAHYSEVSDSLDCWPCTGALTTPTGKARIAYMRRHHPEKAATVLLGAHRILEAARGEVARLVDAVAEPHANIIVPQRTEGIGDCMIAATATATGKTYEAVADALGFPCDPETGLPSLPARRGIAAAELPGPMLRLGVIASVVVSDLAFAIGAPPTMDLTNMVMPADELKRLVRDQSAVLMVPDGAHLHALAWKGGELFDCRADDPKHASLGDVDIVAAVVFADPSRSPG